MMDAEISDASSSHEDVKQPETRSLSLLDGFPTLAELEQGILAMLLVSPEPATVADLAFGADAPVDRVLDAITRLQQQADVPWLLVRHGNEIELTTHPRHTAVVRRFLRLDREGRLSPAALETLAVVAYRQPVTRAEIESVRGVDCSGVLSTLMSRGLLESSGRAPGLGSSLQYATTAAFLHHFGLSSIAELPPLGQIDGNDAAQVLVERSRAAEPGDNDPSPTGIE